MIRLVGHYGRCVGSAASYGSVEGMVQCWALPGDAVAMIVVAARLNHTKTTLLSIMWFLE